ncbi:hypothetical protein B296_00018552, partial [Ensete ventricosum]
GDLREIIGRQLKLVVVASEFGPDSWRNRIRHDDRMFPSPDSIRTSMRPARSVPKLYLLSSCHFVDDVSTDFSIVAVVEKARNELLLWNQGNKIFENWSGDPCSPPWKGFACQMLNHTFTITHL